LLITSQKGYLLDHVGIVGTLHYNYDCASWRNRGHLEGKAVPTNRVNDTYTKAYIAMLEENDSDYEMHCAIFNAELDTSMSMETPALEFNLGTIDHTNSVSEETALTEHTEGSWSDLPLNGRNLVTS
jgi:hypothetical protein